MKITRRQLRKMIAESIGDMNDPYNPDADPDLVLKDMPPFGRESAPSEDKIIGMMVGDDDPNVLDLMQSDPALERSESRDHLRKVIGILQNNPSAFTPRVLDVSVRVYAAIKYYNIYDEHEAALDPLFKALQHHLHKLDPRLF